MSQKCTLKQFVIKHIYRFGCPAIEQVFLFVCLVCGKTLFGCSGFISTLGGHWKDVALMPYC